MLNVYNPKSTDAVLCGLIEVRRNETVIQLRNRTQTEKRNRDVAMARENARIDKLLASMNAPLGDASGVDWYAVSRDIKGAFK